MRQRKAPRKAQDADVREICLEQKVLSLEELERALDPVAMTEPGGEGSAGG